MKPLLLGIAVTGLLLTHDVGAVKPLSNTVEFLSGPFRIPATPPVEGPIPARLQATPRVACALPDGTWLRFENFGADRYKGWSAQMQIDEHGNIFLVTHLGDATPETTKQPKWPEKPTQKLDDKTLKDLRAAAAAFAAGPPYRGHAGLAYAPTFIVRVHLDQGDKEIVLEGYEDDFISHLRRITEFAYATPLAKAGNKPGKAKPAAVKSPARKP
jgi:hypothetical protein